MPQPLVAVPVAEYETAAEAPRSSTRLWFRVDRAIKSAPASQPQLAVQYPPGAAIVSEPPPARVVSSAKTFSCATSPLRVLTDPVRQSEPYNVGLTDRIEASGPADMCGDAAVA
jgi:hypothetical protein